MPFVIDDAIAAAVIPGAISSIGNLLGLGGGPKEAEAQRQLEEARKEFESIGIPTVEAQKLALQKLVSVGTITPEQEQEITTQASKMAEISTDPRLKEAQMKALAQLGELGQGGLTTADRVAIEEERRKVEADENARQGAILQNMASRGVGGSGIELATRLASSQAGANREAEAGQQQLAQAQTKGLQALMQSGQLGGQIRGQEFGEKSDQAKAQDVINQFNTQLRAGTQQRNVASQNQAQYANLANAQDIANKNVALSNEEQERNKALQQQQFQNQLDKARGIAGVAGSQANLAEKQSGTAAQGLGNIASGAGSAFGAYAAKTSADQAAKTAADEREKDRSLTRKIYGVS